MALPMTAGGRADAGDQGTNCAQGSPGRQDDVLPFVSSGFAPDSSLMLSSICHLTSFDIHDTPLISVRESPANYLRTSHTNDY